MAKKKLPGNGSKSNNASAKLRGKKWSELKPGTQLKYKRAGVTPAKFNSWRRPDVRAKAKREGKQRWEVIGLPQKHKVSGAADNTREGWARRAEKNIAGAFGAQPKYSASGVSKYLNENHVTTAGVTRPPQSIERLKKLASAKHNDLWDWIFDPPEDLDDDPLMYH